MCPRDLRRRPIYGDSLGKERRNRNDFDTSPLPDLLPVPGDRLVLRRPGLGVDREGNGGGLSVGETRFFTGFGRPGLGLPNPTQTLEDKGSVTMEVKKVKVIGEKTPEGKYNS